MTMFAPHTDTLRTLTGARTTESTPAPNQTQPVFGRGTTN